MDDAHDPARPEPDEPDADAVRRLPLFPLGTVVFPGTTAPLHVFEERYRALVTDLAALPGPERVFGTVAIREGYEVGDHGTQSLHVIGSLLQLTEVEEHPDGTYDVLAVARQRIRVHGLVDDPAPYPVAIATLLEDHVPAPASERAAAETAARAGAEARFDDYRTALGELGGAVVIDGTLPQEALWYSYALAAACPLPLSERQELLEADDTTTRLHLLHHALREELRAMRAIPSVPATDVARTRWSPN
ncbi:LON peptidase substrate-binding domain-containing protein [Nocardioides massiliensis]|uniref:Lon protease-like protein n=1 Tax=Nocardioides massiliensis TaxID=1325935 RepID=A0ABT9NUI7_9ACTN|nr:LON peptidase substrate-binding domain-containing protein [Nocardioides massiliensis]MDP9823490.1 Lon protease-like protein [Nocardioides massiliensis]